MKTWQSQGSRKSLNLVSVWRTSLGNKDQWGLSYRLYYRESCTPTCTERNFWAISHSQVVQGNLPVAYPVDRHSCGRVDCSYHGLVCAARYCYKRHHFQHPLETCTCSLSWSSNGRINGAPPSSWQWCDRLSTVKRMPHTGSCIQSMT